MEQPSNKSFRSVRYYALAKRWSADLDHFSIETRFLHHLFENYFLAYYSRTYHKKLSALEVRLDALEKEKEAIKQKLDAQLHQLEALVDGKEEEMEKLEKNQIDLEHLFIGLMDGFRILKKELYTFIENTESAHERFESCP